MTTSRNTTNHAGSPTTASSASTMSTASLDAAEIVAKANREMTLNLRVARIALIAVVTYLVLALIGVVGTTAYHLVTGSSWIPINLAAFGVASAIFVALGLSLSSTMKTRAGTSKLFAGELEHANRPRG